MSLKKTLKRLGGEIVYRLKPGHSPRSRTVDIPVFHELGPDDIAIDCGANHGLITRILGAGGAVVHAFEPNPDVFEYLVKNTSHLPGVRCYQKAVLDAPGKMTLHLHLNYDRNPERFASASSLIADKYNVSESGGVEVEVIDLAAFIEALGRPVKVLKIDVEGAEYRVLNRLIDSGLIERIEHVFVETHARMIPSLRAADDALRQRIADRGLGEKIHLSWI